MKWVVFLKPKAGFGYFEGDRVELSAEVAEALATDGFVKLCDTPDKVSDLPADFPGRHALIAADLCTLKDVQDAFGALEDVRGIGKATKYEIGVYLDELKEV